MEDKQQEREQMQDHHPGVLGVQLVASADGACAAVGVVSTTADTRVAVPRTVVPPTDVTENPLP